MGLPYLSPNCCCQRHPYLYPQVVLMRNIMVEIRLDQINKESMLWRLGLSFG